MEDLMKALDFTQEELNLNRLGQVSERQKIRYKREVRKNLALVLALLLGAWIFGIVRSLPLDAQKLANIYYSNIISLMILLTVLCTASFAYMFYLTQKHVAKMDRNEIDHVQGIIQKKAKKREQNITLSVGEKEFMVGLKAADAFLENSPYKIHFVSSSKHILSAEPGW